MHDTDIHSVGCPYGGLAILIKASTIKKVTHLGCCINNRVQCVPFECKGNQFVVFNVYFPCQDADDYNTDVEFICAFMMEIVNNVITPGTVVIVTGYFNVDLAGVDSIHNLTCLSKFINECGLTSFQAHYAGVLNYA